MKFKRLLIIEFIMLGALLSTALIAANQANNAKGKDIIQTALQMQRLTLSAASASTAKATPAAKDVLINSLIERREALINPLIEQRLEQMVLKNVMERFSQHIDPQYIARSVNKIVHDQMAAGAPQHNPLQTSSSSLSTAAKRRNRAKRNKQSPTEGPAVAASSSSHSAAVPGAGQGKQLSDDEEDSMEHVNIDTALQLEIEKYFQEGGSDNCLETIKHLIDQGANPLTPFVGPDHKQTTLWDLYNSYLTLGIHHYNHIAKTAHDKAHLYAHMMVYKPVIEAFLEAPHVQKLPDATLAQAQKSLDFCQKLFDKTETASPRLCSNCKTHATHATAAADGWCHHR